MKKIGIIGCGNMGEAILRGIIANRAARRGSILVCDADSSKLNYIKHRYKVGVALNCALAAKSSNVIILAVKPQDMAVVLKDIAGYTDKTKLLISVAAGVTIKRIAAIVGKDVPVVRAMPNMPALINKGFSALSFSSNVDANSAKMAVKIFSCVGDAVRVKEAHMDAITAISASGPAYFFYLVELLIENGVKLGLGRDIARDAAVKTALGSISLLKDSSEEPAALRKKVTSKGGTTEAAFKVFAKRRLDDIVRKAIKAARDRARELSE